MFIAEDLIKNWLTNETINLFSWHITLICYEADGDVWATQQVNAKLQVWVLELLNPWTDEIMIYENVITYNNIS